MPTSRNMARVRWRSPIVGLLALGLPAVAALAIPAAGGGVLPGMLVAALGVLAALLWRECRRARRGEARLRAAVDASMDELLILEAERGPGGQIVDFRIRDANAQAEATLRRRREELLGSRLSAHLPRSRFEPALARYAAVADGGAPVEETFRVERLGGPAWIRHQVVRLADGVAVTSRDVTEPQVAEERIRRAEAQLAEVTAAMPGAVAQYRLDPDGGFRFTYASPGLQPLFGVSQEALLADPTVLMTLVLPEDRERVRQSLRRSARELVPFRCDYRSRTAQGIRWIRVDALPRREEQGGTVWNCVLTDCTVEKGREAELREARRDAETASRTKSAFLANMSHELRTPLNAIIGFSDTLRAGYFGSLSEKQKEYLQDIRDAGMHLLGIINDVLDLSKIEAGKDRLHEADVPLGGAIAAAVTLVRGHAREKGIRIETPELEALPAVRVDLLKLKQILVNLLSNAVKFTAPHGLVRVAVERGPGAELRLAVADNGAGIAPEDLPRVAEPFWQAEASYTRRAGGTGLGLALVRHLADMHGGTLAIESRVGQGTTVTVTIPAVRVLPADLRQPAGT